jgi:hypothetical protein
MKIVFALNNGQVIMGYFNREREEGDGEIADYKDRIMDDWAAGLVIEVRESILDACLWDAKAEGMRLAVTHINMKNVVAIGYFPE